MIKLVLISAFYIGRLDTPVFAQGVGDIGPVPLDSHPIQFRKGETLYARGPYILLCLTGSFHRPSAA